MYKYFCRIPNKKERIKIIRVLSLELGIPEIKRKLSVYAYHPNGDEAHISFEDKNIFLKFSLKKNEKEAKSPNDKIELKNKNVKLIFKYIASLGFESAVIGKIIRLKFTHEQYGNTTFSYDTFIGDILNVETVDKNLFKKVDNLLKALGHTLINSEDRSTLTKEVDKSLEPIIDKYGVLNFKITEYGDSVALDLKSSSDSISSRIGNFSNDYSFHEKPYSDVVDKELLSTDSIAEKKLFTPVSVVIPSYNSGETVGKTLLSINSQDLTDDQMKMVDVIVVDDGSKVAVKESISHIFGKLRFKCTVIRLEQNLGLSSARNIGISASAAQNIIFIDSDVLLSKNYLREHAVRLSLIPNAVFVSFKKNIEKTDSIAKDLIIQNGLEVPDTFNDLRVQRLINKDSLGLKDVLEDTYVEILCDSDYFKKFGYGRFIGIYDLPAMVIGHNFSLRRKIVEDTNYFSKNFVGWGLEDTYFGARVIANGNFVIPIISTGVYHINHAPRSGSEEKKHQELIKNLSTYQHLLKREL